MHEDDPDIEAVERELRANGFLRPGIDVDLEALQVFLAPMAEPSKVDCFGSTANGCAGRLPGSPACARATSRASSTGPLLRAHPPRVHAGIGVLCQLEREGEFRAEVLRWVPGYFDEAQLGG